VSPDTPAIHLEHLTKQYGSIVALKDVTLDVRPAEVFGFLGVNGAGKSTTIRILIDLVRPTSGGASVFGADCHRDGLEVRSQIGYLPGELGFHRDMTGAAILDLLGRLTGRAIDLSRRRNILDRLELGAADLRRSVREYSTGMKRKLGIVQAFQSDAPLLILDEPTEGLDPVMQDAFYDLLDDVRRRGHTVFMSSHVLPEVERVCDRIGLLRRGELVLVSTVDEVRALAARRVRVVFREDVPPLPQWSAGASATEVSPRAWHLQVVGPLGPLLSAIASLPVSDLDVHEPHLEDVLRRYYRDEPPS
jgi:ABC-2 type transport system ATP-binding protein